MTQHSVSLRPLITAKEHRLFRSALKQSMKQLECSLDLGQSKTTVTITHAGWLWQEQLFPYLEKCKDRTIYSWTKHTFEPVARYAGALIKLVPTDWGPPTFEIDGIKMLPTAKLSPYADAKNKVALIQPHNKIILDTCGGLGYFAAWCLKGGASKVLSYEINPDVIWLRSLNPWSPHVDNKILTLTQGSIYDHITHLSNASVDAILHDPPRFGIAGELYALQFYEQLARVLRRKGTLFHYTGTPNKLTSGRNVPKEVMKRLQLVGFKTKLIGDGILATKN